MVLNRKARANEWVRLVIIDMVTKACLIFFFFEREPILLMHFLVWTILLSTLVSVPRMHQ